MRTTFNLNDNGSMGMNPKTRIQTAEFSLLYQLVLHNEKGKSIWSGEVLEQ